MIAKYGAGFRFRDVIAAGFADRDARSSLNRQMASFFGVRYVVLFSSGRDALVCLLRAVGGSGHAAVPAYNCIAVPEAVTRAGWQPLLVDIAPGSVNMTRETLEASIIPGTRAVIMTHQFGIPSCVESIVAFCRDRGIVVVEDAAASVGASYKGRPVGSLGDAAIVSFGLTKVAPVGRLGALLTDDEALARKASAFQKRQAGMVCHVLDCVRAGAWWVAMQPPNYTVMRRARSLLGRDNLHERVTPHSEVASRVVLPCSASAATLAGIQLGRLRANVASRQELARIYEEELSGCQGIALCPVPTSAEPAWMQFPVFVKRKDHCYRYLLRHGVDLSWTFRYSCGESYGRRTLPNTDYAVSHLLGLPTYGGVSPETARNICALLRDATHE